MRGESQLTFPKTPELTTEQMEISKFLRDHSRTIMGKQQLIVGSVAKALEIIPRQICDNAGLDATDVLNKLRMRHAQGDLWAGVDVDSEGVQDNMKAFVWEPALVKTNALSSAVDAACLILSVDETVRNPQSEVCHVPRFGSWKLTLCVATKRRTSHAERNSTKSDERTRKRDGTVIDLARSKRTNNSIIACIHDLTPSSHHQSPSRGTKHSRSHLS